MFGCASIHPQGSKDRIRHLTQVVTYLMIHGTLYSVAVLAQKNSFVTLRLIVYGSLERVVGIPGGDCFGDTLGLVGLEAHFADKDTAPGLSEAKPDPRSTSPWTSSGRKDCVGR